MLPRRRLRRRRRALRRRLLLLLPPLSLPRPLLCLCLCMQVPLRPRPRRTIHPRPRARRPPLPLRMHLPKRSDANPAPAARARIAAPPWARPPRRAAQVHLELERGEVRRSEFRGAPAHEFVYDCGSPREGRVGVGVGGRSRRNRAPRGGGRVRRRGRGEAARARAPRAPVPGSQGLRPPSARGWRWWESFRLRFRPKKPSPLPPLFLPSFPSFCLALALLSGDSPAYANPRPFGLEGPAALKETYSAVGEDAWELAAYEELPTLEPLGLA
ncbi:hypothetical protein B0H14DRAFT_2992010 [Mycena olivaceomarginata]|nr:hypothetical protein B0H14DRAFT_2992010 [Mycena olivaceomarginata]